MSPESTHMLLLAFTETTDAVIPSWENSFFNTCIITGSGRASGTDHSALSQRRRLCGGSRPERQICSSHQQVK